MPIRSPRGRAAAYRGLWQWPLRSPARLAVTVAALVVLAVGMSVAGAATDGSADRGVLAGPSPSATARGALGSSGLRPPAPAATPTPTALPPVPELVPSSLPVSQAPAASLEVAARWAAAWLRPPDGTTAQQWLDGLRTTTTEEYLLSVLSAVDPANIPATQVTGEPRPVRVAPRSVQVEVPTDALTLLVLVVDTDSGWLVTSHDRV